MGQNREQEKNVREDDFGDDGGTRVGRPDSEARLSQNSENGLEGKILEKGADEESEGPNQQKVQRESGRGDR